MYSAEYCEVTNEAILSALHGCLALQFPDSALRLDVQFLGRTSFARKLQETAVMSYASEATRLLVVRVVPARIYLSLFPLPLFQSASAPCPECLDRRLWSALSNSEQESMTLGFGFETNDSPYLMGPVLENVSLLAKSLVARQETSGSRTYQVFSIHLISQQITSSELMADSFCGSCPTQEAVSADGAVLKLREQVKARSGKGRMKGLAEYTLPVRALINPVCGVAALHAIPGYAQSVTAPVFGQYAQRAYEVPPRTVTWSGLCTRTDESRTAGVLEALERQAGMLAHPARTAVVDSYNNVSAEAMDPALCFGYNEECYTLPLGLTRYSPDLPLAWVWGFSLLSKRSVLVPKQLVYYDRLPKTTVKLIDNNSSGCALGSCYEEAILRGLFELLERDSFVIAWYRKLAFPRIDPASCTDRKTRLILDRVKLLGYELSLLDARLDLKIPAVIAIGRRRDREIGAMVVGASANTDATEAVRGALLEAATSIVEIPSLMQAKQDHIRKLAADYLLVKTVADHGLLYGLPKMAEKAMWIDGNSLRRSMDEAFPADREWHSGGDIAADLNRCLSELTRCGVQDVIAVDLTTREQRELNLKTVRMIVPGLAPIDFGFPRNRVERLPRLYSAPEAARLSPVDEGGLNPLPHPFP